jgi:poly-beta-hydroxyalkanoate depolymerase
MPPEHDLATDWQKRARPTHEGCFGFDDYTDHLIRFLEAIGPGAHILAASPASPRWLPPP